MRVEVAMRSTGLAYFPGLAKPSVVESDRIAPAKAAELRRLVAAANFFALPSEPAPRHPGAADHRTYTITVEEGTARHSVTVSDPIEAAALRELIAFVRESG